MDASHFVLSTYSQTPHLFLGEVWFCSSSCGEIVRSGQLGCGCRDEKNTKKSHDTDRIGAEVSSQGDGRVEKVAAKGLYKTGISLAVRMN